jgi:hypothetical protein
LQTEGRFAADAEIVDVATGVSSSSFLGDYGSADQ